MKVASAPAHTQGSRGVRRAVVALLTLALAVRVGAVVATPAYLPLQDDRDYDRLACWISDHGAPPEGLLATALGAVFLPLVLDGTSLISEPLFVAVELAVLEYRRRPGGVGWAIAAGALAGLVRLLDLAGTRVAPGPPRSPSTCRPQPRSSGPGSCG